MCSLGLDLKLKKWDLGREKSQNVNSDSEGPLGDGTLFCLMPFWVWYLT